MKKFSVFFKIILFSILLVSCSKNDVEPASDADGKDGGTISRFQIVMVEFADISNLNDSYEGTFNNKPITLSKVEDKKLMFYVDQSTTLGKVRLAIPTLNDAKIDYNVTDAVLTQTPEATLEPLTNFQKQYGATLTNVAADAPYVQNHNSLTSYLANLSAADKMRAAKFYKTNKTIFDAVYNTNYNAVQGRFANKTQTDFNFTLYRSLINRHILAVAVTVIAGTLAAVPPYDPVETTICVGIALTGIKKSADFHKQIVEDVFRVVQVNLNGILGQNNRLATTTNSTATSSIITLTDNQLITIPFNVNARTFNNSDSNVQKEFVQKFFSAKVKLNNFIIKLNSTIAWLNTNIPLINLSSIAVTNVPTATSNNSFKANAQIMQRFAFSVNHPNLQLEAVTLGSTGQLSFRIKFVGNPTTISITSTLRYTYNDDFSSFSGSFPIKVTKEQMLTGVSFANKTAVGAVCIGFNHSCNWDVRFVFDGNVTPIGAKILSRTIWDAEGDGTFEGNIGGSFLNIPITSQNSTANIVTNNSGFCWGRPSTKVKIQYRYVSAQGLESAIYESIVPR